MTATRSASSFFSRRPLRVLILEDTPADAELMVAMLKRAGYVLSYDLVESAEDCRQRLEQTDYDVVLCDHNLRSWTGMEALEIVRQVRNDLPFVVVTGVLGDEAAVEYIKRGASDYLLKHRLQRLPVAVGQVLREKAQREETARLQEEIFAAKKEWELTFDTVPDPVLLLDESGCIRRANRAAATLLQLEFSQLIGRPCHEVLHGQNEICPECPHAQMLELGEQQRGDFEEPRLGRTFDFTSTPLRDPGGAFCGCVLVLRDITDRKRLEEQLRQAQKMEAIGRLAGGVAHDFNNHLMVIQGYAELVASRARADERLQQYAEEIRAAGDRAGALIRQLLAFSRKQVLLPEVLELNRAVAGMEKMLARLIGEHIELQAALDPEAGRIKVDPTQLEQVILNLVLNARDAMPQGGKLTVETASVHLDETYAREHYPVSPGPHVMLAVTDTGVGMPAETRSHVFEPFFTTKEQGKGTGLGLATVYGIVKQSNGHIWVYSEPGQGTTFKVYFPRVDEPVTSVRAAQPARQDVRGSETVLVVEDEETLRRVTCEFLEASGYTTLQAGNGEEALRVAEEHSGPIHLLLTDVVMPKLSGARLAERLAERRPQTRVLYVSGYADNTIVHHGVLEKGMNYLQKPFSREALLQKVRRVLDSGSPPDTAEPIGPRRARRPSR